MFNTLKWIGYSIASLILLLVSVIVYFGIENSGKQPQLFSKKDSKNRIQIDTVYVEKVIRDTVFIDRIIKDTVRVVPKPKSINIQPELNDTINKNEQ